ncbi:plancitoxin-1-like isoform X2 [Euwallacea similis]|uniref:plancitoxin-1-like isoform X2 n=1 Tax=Euwallacea similis TaxID=1736056 RepID=UPI00344B87FA
MFYNTISFVYMLVTFHISYGLQCKDQQGNSIDWYVAYKLPKQTKHENALVKEGLGYMYMTSDDHNQWIFSETGINSSNSLIGNTLNPLYNNAKKYLSILYNDQPPQGHAGSKGHTKGVVIADKTSGLWLIHSVPNFPYSLNQYEYPDSGTHYGQSFLCLSLGVSDLNSVGIQLQYNEPQIFAQNVPETMKSIFPELEKAARNETVEDSPWYRIANINTQKGANFVSFAKSGNFEKDLYADLVSASLETNLYVETWPNEPNRLPSDCDHIYQVDNVLSISLSISSEVNMSFTSTTDHSKWAISTSQDSSKWLCIGDINRAEKQTERGGGTTCINNKVLAQQYAGIVSSVQQCDNSSFLMKMTGEEVPL